MAVKIPKSLRDRVRKRAQHRCEYCQASEWLSGQRCHIDHITPLALNGSSALNNLCLACAACNGFKLDKIQGVDPESNKLILLFNPRDQQWNNHFEWSNDGTHIIGLTPCGRATVFILKLNRPLAITARTAWVSIGKHPPNE